MKKDLFIQDDIIIPAHELEMTTSRAGGPGGQHVNKTSTRVSVRWNIQATTVLNDELKERVLKKLEKHLTNEGELILHNAETKSQLQNKRLALEHLAEKIRDALIIPKKRKPTKTTKTAKEKRKKAKKVRSDVKKMRKKVQFD